MVRGKNIALSEAEKAVFNEIRIALRVYKILSELTPEELGYLVDAYSKAQGAEGCKKSLKTSHWTVFLAGLMLRFCEQAEEESSF